MEHASAVSGPVPDTLHPRLADALRRLCAAEKVAGGADRRAAHRLTRAVLGSARADGVPLHQLADCLGVTVGSTRGRAMRTDTTVSAAAIESLTGHTPAELRELSSTPLGALSV
jgi:hypothetical protein